MTSDDDQNRPERSKPKVDMDNIEKAFDEEIADDDNSLDALDELDEDNSEESADNKPPKRKKKKPVRESSVRQEIEDKRKKRRKRLLQLGGGLLVIYLIYLLFIPRQLDIPYGICKVFLELQVKYPQELRISGFDQVGSEFRLWYTRIDPFGEYRLERIQCFYRNDERTGFALDKVIIDNVEVAREKVDLFNVSIPTLYENPPVVYEPVGFEAELRNLKVDTDRYYRSFFN